MTETWINYGGCIGVACPVCGAKKHRRCWTVARASGQTMRKVPHDERVRLAKEKREGRFSGVKA